MPFYKIGLPLVSVIIPNYNGRDFLLRCLQSVIASQYTNIEVVVVDNGSNDATLQGIKEGFNDIRIKTISLDKNYGPAYARNRGIQASGGKYIAFLDNDTAPQENWLDSPIEIMEQEDDIGVCQCKLLLLKKPKEFDYIGDYLGQFGFLVQRVKAGQEDNGEYDSRCEIFSAKSAAMVVRREMLDKTGFFDEDYFIYLEETDLCWRGWLAGYRVMFIPESIVYHEFGGSALSLGARQNYFAKYHGSKNYISTLIKNLGALNLIKMLPVHIFSWTGVFFWLLLHGKPREAGYVLKGMLWVFFNLAKLAKKRRRVCRVFSDKELLPRIMRKRSLKYFYNKIARPQNIGLAEGFYRQRRR